MNQAAPYRIGLGIDSHRIADGGPMVLGGVRHDVPFHFVGHSDADVLLHAITDALLSGAGLADIGELFPNTASENNGRDSGEMLAIAKQQVDATGWRIGNIDCVIETEVPKITPVKQRMIQRIAEILQIAPSSISLKGKTGEGVGEIGRRELARVTCIAMLVM